MERNYPSPPESRLSDTQYASLDPTDFSRVVGALLDIVTVQHGERLLAEDLDEIRLCLEAQVAAAKTLDAYPLANSDEPAFVFTPRAGDE